MACQSCYYCAHYTWFDIHSYRGNIRMSSRVGDSELKFINTHCQLSNMQYGCLATLCVCVCVEGGCGKTVM